MTIKINLTKTLLLFTLVMLSLKIFAGTGNQDVMPSPDNWALVGLIISEIASLVSKKYSGIIQGAFMLIHSIFAKKK